MQLLRISHLGSCEFGMSEYGLFSERMLFSEVRQAPFAVAQLLFSSSALHVQFCHLELNSPLFLLHFSRMSD